MRVPKEIIVLLVLLAGVMAFVLWYVIDRRAKLRTEQNAPRFTSTTVAPAPAPVALGGANDQKTIDFSSGQPVVKNSAADQAALTSALQDIAAATEGVTFEPKAKTTAPAPATPPKS